MPVLPEVGSTRVDAGRDQALAFRGLDHGDADAVLDRASGLKNSSLMARSALSPPPPSAAAAGPAAWRRRSRARCRRFSHAAAAARSRPRVGATSGGSGSARRGARRSWWGRFRAWRMQYHGSASEIRGKVRRYPRRRGRAKLRATGDGTSHATTGSRPDRIPLARIVNPRSIAVIGASDDVGNFGGRVIHYLIRHGFGGGRCRSTRSRATICGLPAFAGQRRAGAGGCRNPRRPGAALLRQVEDCAAAGVGACIVITGKLADAGPAGAALQAQVLAVARAAGMRLVGPNCPGIFNVTDTAMLSSSLALEVEGLKPGGIGMVSQSGALMGALVSLGQRFGAGSAAASRSATRLTSNYATSWNSLSTTPPPRSSPSISRDCATPPASPRCCAGRAGGQAGALRQGRADEAGAQAARSHTASLAGALPPSPRCAGMPARCCWTTRPPWCWRPTRWTGWRRLPRAGMGLAVIASSGGSTVTTTDMLPEAGLRLATMSDATRAELGALDAGKPCPSAA